MKYFLILATVMLMPFITTAQTDTKEQPVRRCEVMPTLGECSDLEGDQAIRCTTIAIGDHITSSIIYPQVSIDAGIEGMVYVSFIIEKDGNVSDVKILRGFAEDNEATNALNEQAKQAIMTLPKFTSGMNAGEKVRVEYVSPVRFELP